MAALIVLIAVGAVLGLLVGRFWAVAMTAAGVVAYYVGLHSGWWGNGTGDAWEYAMAIVLVAASAIVAAAVFAGRARRRRTSA